MGGSAIYSLPDELSVSVVFRGLENPLNNSTLRRHVEIASPLRSNAQGAITLAWIRTRHINAGVSSYEERVAQ